MDEANFYWEIFAAAVSAVWIVTVFIRDHRSQSLALSSALMTRLMEYDKLNIENPAIQKYISQNAEQDETFFCDPINLDEAIFYQAKTLVYTQLNLFDELLSIASRSSGIWSFLSAGLFEQKDWEEYMKQKMRHPFYRSILIREADIYGASLRAFWKRNRKSIESKPVDAFVW